MKRAVIIFSAAVLCLTAAFNVLFGIAAEKAFRSETDTVYRLCGAFADEYPGSEKKAASVLAGEDNGYTEAGRAALAKYGYDAERTAFSEQRYREIIVFEIICSAALSGLILLCGALYIRAVRRERRRQEDLIVSMLDKCISGGEEQTMLENAGLIGNDMVSDELIKVCGAMKLKSDTLSEERDNTKSLVTDISHQLKTPLSALKSCFAVYKEADSIEERTEFVNRCEAQIDKLEALTASLINISRLETGIITLEETETSVTDILIQSINSVYYKAADKNINIVTEEFEDVTVNADKKWTAEAIANIIDNAVKYSPAGTDIKLRVIKMFSFVRIEIEDSGTGIPRSERNRVFERFYRGNSADVKKQDGTGVGLYLTRRLIENQGGTVSVRPAAGGGSIFVVQLML